RLGVTWSPIEQLAVRGSVGTSFKAPLLSQLQPVTNVFLLSAPDPSSSTGSTKALVLIGAKGKLSPEEATTWSAGLQLKPATIPALNVRLDYFNIDFRKRIRVPADNIFVPLANERVYGSIITRQPDAEAVNALFNEPGFHQTPIPPDQVGAIIDDRLSNVASTRMKGI